MTPETPAQKNQQGKIVVAKATNKFTEYFISSMIDGKSHNFFTELILPGMKEKRMVVVTIACIHVKASIAEQLAAK